MITAVKQIQQGAVAQRSEDTLTAAEQVVARLDAYSQDQHQDNLEAARERLERRKQARRERARAAAARLRSA